MAIALTPYLTFKDKTREAMEFYRAIFGGELTMNTFEEFHVSDDPAEADKIMHSQLKTDTGLTIMAADTPNSMEFHDSARISMSLSGGSDDDAMLSGFFEKLSEGGKVVMPLEPAIWGDKFGTVVDKFGIQWMINIGKQE
ncbi:MAG TPA: VOC family protein [Candidatus Saccharimonadales bacterium]|nr:VOC family protein [Candidatus Saccharimonadales bacterium]